MSPHRRPWPACGNVRRACISPLEAAANALDTDLTSDLVTMIERTEGELATVHEKIQGVARLRAAAMVGDREPSNEELRVFVASMLSNFDRHLREPEVIDEAIREHREMWVKLYRASLRFDARDS